MPDNDAVTADFRELEPIRCPCGWARCAFTDVEAAPVSVHQVEIEADARNHYHRVQTEIYYVLECAQDAYLEMNGDRVPLRDGMAVLIRPGVRHPAIGPMRILNIVSPPFDPNDEWFDEPS